MLRKIDDVKLPKIGETKLLITVIGVFARCHLVFLHSEFARCHLVEMTSRFFAQCICEMSSRRDGISFSHFLNLQNVFLNIFIEN